MKETDETRGLTQRELVLEIREDVKALREAVVKKPDRSEVYTVLGLLVTVLLAVLAA